MLAGLILASNLKNKGAFNQKNQSRWQDSNLRYEGSAISLPKLIIPLDFAASCLSRLATPAYVFANPFCFIRFSPTVVRINNPELWIASINPDWDNILF